MILLKGITHNEINTKSRVEIELLASKIGVYVEEFGNENHVHLTDNFKIITKEHLKKRNYKIVTQAEMERKKEIKKNNVEIWHYVSDKTNLKRVTAYQKLKRVLFEKNENLLGQEIPVYTKKEADIVIDYINNHPARFSVLRLITPLDSLSFFKSFILVSEISNNHKVKQFLGNKKYALKMYNRRVILKTNLNKALKDVKEYYGDDLYEKAILV